MRRWLDRWFEHEIMNGDGRCPVYLHRWTLLTFGPYSVYLHHFVGDDWSFDLHDHPKRFISIGLWGSYVEETPTRDRPGFLDHTIYRAPWVRTFPATHIHRIRLTGPFNDRRPCWTLVIVLRAVRAWGFWHDGEWIPWREYVDSDTATEMKSCR